MSRVVAIGRARPSPPRKVGPSQPGEEPTLLAGGGVGTPLAAPSAVTVRFTVAGNAGPRLIGVAGRLTHEELAELWQLIGCEASGVCIDLSELRSLDPAALAALRRLRQEGVALQDIPPHLAWRIDDDFESE